MITPLNDRRDFRRMTIESPVQIIFNGQTINGVCLDLSATGMSLEVTDSVFQVDDQIELILNGGTDTASSLTGAAKIIRVSQQQDKYLLAVVFTKVE